MTAAFDQLRWWPDKCPQCGKPWVSDLATSRSLNYCEGCGGVFACMGKGVVQALAPREVEALPSSARGFIARARGASDQQVGS